MPSRNTTLTKSRLFALVQQLAQARTGPVPTSDVVAAVRAAPWAERYRYQRIYTALLRCRAQGVLQSVVQPNTQRGTGRQRMVHHWWPLETLASQPAEAHDTAVEIARLVDQTIAALPTGAVIRPEWVVRQTGGLVVACTEAAVTRSLAHRGAGQRPCLAPCDARSGWAGWWRVVDEDSGRQPHRQRQASAALFWRIRAEQTRTGRSAVEVRALARGLSVAQRKTLVARVRMASHVPTAPGTQIMRTPRLVRVGSVHYASYVVPLGEEHLARAELDVEAWWSAATLLERRHDQEARTHALPGDEVTACGRRAPYAEALRELHAALAVIETGTTHRGVDSDRHWTALSATWLARCTWGITQADAAAGVPVPKTTWISVPTLHRAMHRLLATQHVPDIRLLRFRLQYAGVWMRPARLIDSTPATGSQSNRAASASTVVEAVDAYFWLHSHYVTGNEQGPYRWAWRWLGLCRDWAAIRAAVARRPGEQWVPLARTALRVATAARSAFAPT